VDEAGRSTQPPLVMAPPGTKADPDGEAAGTVVDNSLMARTRTENSRSAAKERANGSNGSTVDSVTSPAAEASDAGAGGTVPLPAETIRQAKARPDGESADKGQDGARQASRPTTAKESSAPAAASVPAPAASPRPAKDAAPAVKSESKPSFTPSETTASASVPQAAAMPTAAASAARSGSPSYSGSSYAGTAAATPSTYTRSEWGGAETPAPAPAAGGPGSPSSNGYSSGNGFPSGAAAAFGGAASGLAGSVSSAWQKRGSGKGTQARKPSKRQAMLTLARVEPWSVMKFSFIASVVAFVILFVAVAVLYMVLSALGVFDSLQNTVSSITSSQSSSGTNISHWFSASLILGYTALLGALNIVLITAMATIGSVIYNLIAKTIGGIEVTLRETD